MKGREIFMSAVTAFIIGAGTSLTVGLAAGNGRLNDLALVLIGFAGLVTAAKDYRSLMRLPPVDSGPPRTGQDQDSVKVNKM